MTKPRRNGQTRTDSAIESGSNVLIGYMISVFIGQIIYPMFGYAVSIADNAAMTALFVAASMIRSYTCRRLFNWWQHRK